MNKKNSYSMLFELNAKVDRSFSFMHKGLEDISNKLNTVNVSSGITIASTNGKLKTLAGIAASINTAIPAELGKTMKTGMSFDTKISRISAIPGVSEKSYENQNDLTKEFYATPYVINRNEASNIAFSPLRNFSMEESQSERATGMYARVSANAYTNIDQFILSFQNNGASGKYLLKISQILNDTSRNADNQMRTSTTIAMFGQESIAELLVLVDNCAEKLDVMKNSFKNADDVPVKMESFIQINLRNAIEKSLSMSESFGISTFALYKALYKWHLFDTISNIHANICELTENESTGKHTVILTTNNLDIYSNNVLKKLIDVMPYDLKSFAGFEYIAENATATHRTQFPVISQVITKFSTVEAFNIESQNMWDLVKSIKSVVIADQSIMTTPIGLSIGAIAAEVSSGDFACNIYKSTRNDTYQSIIHFSDMAEELTDIVQGFNSKQLQISKVKNQFAVLYTLSSNFNIATDKLDVKVELMGVMHRLINLSGKYKSNHELEIDAVAGSLAALEKLVKAEHELAMCKFDYKNRIDNIHRLIPQFDSPVSVLAQMENADKELIKLAEVYKKSKCELKIASKNHDALSQNKESYNKFSERVITASDYPTIRISTQIDTIYKVNTKIGLQITELEGTSKAFHILKNDINAYELQFNAFQKTQKKYIKVLINMWDKLKCDTLVSMQEMINNLHFNQNTIANLTLNNELSSVSRYYISNFVQTVENTLAAFNTSMKIAWEVRTSEKTLTQGLIDAAKSLLPMLKKLFGESVKQDEDMVEDEILTINMTNQRLNQEIISSFQDKIHSIFKTTRKDTNTAQEAIQSTLEDHPISRIMVKLGAFASEFAQGISGNRNMIYAADKLDNIIDIFNYNHIFDFPEIDKTTSYQSKIREIINSILSTTGIIDIQDTMYETVNTFAAEDVRCDIQSSIQKDVYTAWELADSINSYVRSRMEIAPLSKNTLELEQFNVELLSDSMQSRPSAVEIAERQLNGASKEVIPDSLGNGSPGANFSVQISPSIIIQGNADTSTVKDGVNQSIKEAIPMMQAEFDRMLANYLQMQRRVNFA